MRQLLAVVALLALIALMPVAALPADYSIGELLSKTSDSFRTGYITGFLAALFTSGMQCPLAVSGSMLEAAIQMEVQAKRIAREESQDVALIKALANMGCSAPWGKKVPQSQF